jgi:hypothetical protein
MVDLHAGCECGYDVSTCESKWRGRYFDGGSTAAVMLTDSYADLVARTKNGRRDARKAERLGYTVRRFHYPSHTADIDAIHHSKPIRSGGAMQGHYRDHLPPSEPFQYPDFAHCLYHWDYWFGCFLEDTLVAYIKLVRVGDVATYMQILGHGAHLENGVMFLLHFRLMEWALNRPAELEGCAAIFYINDNPGVRLWKAKAGFVEGVRL